VIASGATHSVRRFCEIAFGHVGLSWEDHVTIDEKFMRPAEVDLLIGDASKAKATLGWAPRTSCDHSGRVLAVRQNERNQLTCRRLAVLQ
jgi:GDP-D-mannose dehydratase